MFLVRRAPVPVSVFRFIKVFVDHVSPCTHLILANREVHVEMGRLDRSFRRLADAYCISYVVVKDRRLPFQPIFPNTADLRTSIDTIQCACGRDALTPTHEGAMHREQCAGDGQIAHRRKRCVHSDVRQTAWTVPL